MKIYFSHEKLQAYRKALAFAAWCEPILERVPKSTSVHGQLDRARTSAPLNIAEGNGKYTPEDKCKFFDIAHGSALESASCLDLLSIKQALTEVELDEGKTLLSDLVGCLIGLIKSKLLDRFVMHDDAVEYRAGDGTGLQE
jgi:four helix bundle protein